MLLSWTALSLLLLAAATAWFWQDSLAARERANSAAIEACERLSLQFLDGTVAFARIGWSRGRGGWLTLRRTYVFDYTANSIERLQGFVVLTGHQVETVGYAAANSSGQNSLPHNSGHVTEPGHSIESANILDLNRWRANHRPAVPPPRDSREDRGDQCH